MSFPISLHDIEVGVGSFLAGLIFMICWTLWLANHPRHRGAR